METPGQEGVTDQPPEAGRVMVILQVGLKGWARTLEHPTCTKGPAAEDICAQSLEPGFTKMSQEREARLALVTG